MTVQLIGVQTLGACLPLAVQASAAATASIGVVLPEIQAKIAGLIALQANLALTPPSLGANLAAATDLVAALTASLSVGLPGVDFQVAAVAAALGELNATLGALNANLALLARIDFVLSGAGVALYRMHGPVQQVADEARSELIGGIPGGGGPSAPVFGAMLLTEGLTAQIALATATGI